MKGLLDGGLLTIRQVTLACRPPGRSAGDESAEQYDERDGKKLDAEAR